MEASGFIQLSRKLFDHQLWREARVYSRAEAWVDLVQMAAFEPHKRIINGQLIQIPKGGIAASLRFLASRWLWSDTKVRAFLGLLRVDGMVTTEKTQGITIVLLCNFDRYNSRKNADKTQRERSGNAAGTQREEGKEGEEHTDSPSSASLTPSLVTVLAAAQTMGVTPHVAELFFLDCDKRPLSAKGKWTDRDGNEMRNWQSGLKGFAMRWQSNEAQSAQRNQRPGKPVTQAPAEGADW